MTEISTAALMVTAVVVILTTIVFVMLVVVFPRTSSGFSQDSRDRGSSPVPNTSSLIASSSSSSSPGSWKYDVFLSFRGEDTRKTFVDHLYSALVQRTIHAYKDDETLPRGDTIGSSLLKAIEESHIALIIFSKNYADSSWCLDELAYIMKCKEERGQIVIPIFYDVDPSDVRTQKGQLGKAFSKHKSVNNNKVESWRKSLRDASNIAGWETKLVANGHEAKCINEIVGSVLDKLLTFNSVVDENLVGMGTRLQDLKSRLRIGSGGVRMVGIWGVGGGGKTTLATSLYMEISANFNTCCFVGNIREESSQHNGLKNLQEKILSNAFDKKLEVPSVDIGKHMIKNMLCRRNVLIVLDDVDDLEQLEALAGSHSWFGGGSRIIITTRDEHLLITHRVDKVCPVRLLSDDEALRLFKRHAYQENNPVEDYDDLSLHVIYYVNGLPLAVKILGSILYGKNKYEWISALEKLKDIPISKVTDQLKISYDGLDHVEKELFLDIACFLRGESEDEAMEKLDACGFHPRIGMKVLRQKSLITIYSHGKVDMHDLVQEMGYHIVRGEHPNNPEKHRRVWLNEDIEDMVCRNAIMENEKIEAIKYSYFDPPSTSFITLVSNLKKLRFLDVTSWDDSSCDEGPNFLSNELKYINWYWYPPSLFPKSFQPRKLVVLKLKDSLQKELWKGYKYMPCLKELELIDANALVRTPDIGGLSCLQNLIISRCESLEEIHESTHTSLVYVCVRECNKLTMFPKIESNMDSLVNLHLKNVGIEVLPSSVGRYCTNLISLKLVRCSKLKSIEGNFHALKHLQKFVLDGDTQLEKLPKDLFDEKCCLEELILDLRNLETTVVRPGPPQLPRFLRKLNISGFKLKGGEIPTEISELSNLQELHLCDNGFLRLDFSFSRLTRLKLLDVSGCYYLVKLPKLPPNLAILQADYCELLAAIGNDIYSNCKWLCQVSIKSFGSSLVGGERLLESMLQGKAQCMSLNLKGLEIPQRFEPRLLRGSEYRLQLPENWFSEYTGFLFCSVFYRNIHPDSIKITMKQQQLEMGTGDSQVLWEEEGVNGFQTWVGYVSFGSLKCTTWWDQTFAVVNFSIDLLRRYYDDPSDDKSLIRGFGVRLLSKENQMEETTTTNSTSEFGDDDYKCNFNFQRDSGSLLECQFNVNQF